MSDGSWKWIEKNDTLYGEEESHHACSVHHIQ